MPGRLPADASGSGTAVTPGGGGAAAVAADLRADTALPAGGTAAAFGPVHPVHPAHAANTPHIPVRPDWLAQHGEPILEPELPIIDAHHHLWDRPGARYLFDQFLADVNSGHNIVATIYAQCRTMYRADGASEMMPLGEVEFINGLAAQSASGLYGKARLCAGIIGGADLRLGERLDPVLEAMLSAAGGRLRGMRNSTAWHADERVRSNPIQPPPGMLSDPAFRAGAVLLGRHRLVLDIWAYHSQLHEVLDLARALPQVRIVLNHAGGPVGIGPYAGKRQEVFSAWFEAMAALAELPNVYVKLGGLAMQVGGFDFHLLAVPPDSLQLAAAWRPYIESSITLFGPQRCMFESNFPVDKGMCSHAVLWNAFKRLATQYSTAEKSALFSVTAASVYRLQTD